MRGHGGPGFEDAKENKATSFGGGNGGGIVNMPQKIRRSGSVEGRGFYIQREYLDP